MWTVVAVTLLLAVFAALLAAVRRVRRRPFGVELLLAFAATVCAEAVILNALSVFRAVTREGVVAAHLLLLGLLWTSLRGLGIPGTLRRAAWTLRRLGWGGAILLPAAALVALSAWRYAPNGWDSMSYHLARVAHWIQQGSVANHETHVVRQVALQPGAEYLILALQVVSGHDRLAASVQLAAWVAVVLAAPALARAAGAPRALAPWAAPLVGAAPMIVLQASSTQNDLVAAAAALAGVAASMPFLHRAPGRWRLPDAALLGPCLAAGAVVKLTATLAALPLVAVAVLASVRRLAARAEPLRRALAGVALVLVAASVVVLPEVVRRSGDARLHEYVARFTYPVLGEVPDRAVNVVRSLLRHVPAPRAVAAAVGIPERCIQNGWLASDALASHHEEYAGNTLLALLALAACAVAAARWRRLPGRARLFVGTTLAGWILFQLAFRDNEWISRLQVPLFALSAVLLAALGGLAPRFARPVRAAVIAAALVAAASGTRTAAGNVLRPPLRALPLEVPAADGYYVERPWLRWVHETVLTSARSLGCRRLGLALNEDSWDYPLTWPAMLEGIAVRHVRPGDPWPCLVFADPPTPTPEAFGWQRTPIPFLYRNGAGDGAGPDGR